MKSRTFTDKSGNVYIAPLLADATGVGRLLSVSPQYVRQLDAAGKIPRAIESFGRRKLWSVADLDRWVKAGCPRREKWAKVK
jgi:hypothetical protein